MNRMLAVAAREISERRGIFGAAGAFALLSVIVAIVPGLGFRGSEVMRMTSAVLAAVVCCFIAALLGATLVGNEVTENRLPFYFSRPLSPGAIWFGKMAGAAVLLLCAFAIIITPFLAVELAKSAHWWSDTVSSYVGSVSLVAVGLFFAGHLLSTMARSRSPWIVLDLVCAVLTVVAFRAILEFPASISATDVQRRARLIMLAGVPILIFLSGLWQLRRGRADRLQQHHALSRFLWGGAAVFLFAGASYTTWAMFVAPGDLLAPHGLRAGGDWVLVTGSALGRGGYEPTLLLNADGRYVSVFIPPPLVPEFRFSADGRAAVWLRASAAGHELVHCRLDARRPHPEETGVLAEHIVALSPDGSLAITGNDVFAVYDLAERRSRGAFRFADSTGPPTIEFVSHDRVRAYVPVVHGLSALEVREFDLRSGQLRQTEDLFRAPWPWSPTELRYGMSRILIAREGGTSAQLLDGLTGRSFAVSPNHLWPVRWRGKVEWMRDDLRDLRFETKPIFLSDGTVAAPLYSVEPPPDGESFRVISESPREIGESTTASWTLTRSGGAMAIFSGDDGHRLAIVSLGPWQVQRVEGGDRHRVLVTARNVNASSSTLAWVDFDRGVFQPVNLDIQRPIVDPERPLPKEILCETGTSIVAWNPSSGAVRVVAGN